MKRAVHASAIALALLCGPVLGNEALTGPAVVLDGDTLRLKDAVVGLFGIAAPAPEQTCEGATGLPVACGADAAQALAGHIGAASVVCEPRGLDRHRRPVALCRVGGEDLSAWMVARGHAVADRLSAPDYVPQETKAWATRRGLWAGVFEEPSRRRVDASAPARMASLTR
ncbi:thermonuclease family protein [uncultured Methylobacterium sp.]|uniref:thermonuclease family protein n=1 Tax=uncultured Methylobacterium sp. TaxID=157278 RepID=UPI0035CC1C68